MRSRRTTLALLASVALHGLVALWLLRVKPPAPPAWPPATHLEFEVVQRPARPPAPPLPRSPAKHTPLRRAPNPQPEPEPQASEPAEEAAAELKPEPPAVAAAKPDPATPDVPARVDLAPHLSPEPKASSPTDTAEPSGGEDILLHNRPAQLPSPSELTRQERARVKTQSEALLKDQLADRRVSNGLTDPYFELMRKAFDEVIEHPPPLKVPNAVNGAIEGWVGGLQSYGQSGTPYPNGQAPTDADTDMIANLARQQELRTGRPGGLQEGGFNAAQMLATARDFHGQDPSITAVVEFRQRRDGTLAETRLLTSSGDRAFDAFVLGTAPKGLSKLPKPPDNGTGIHPSGIKSIWAFTGKRTYLKELKDFKGGGDKAYATAMGLLGAITGSTRFDDSGRVQVSDYRHPTFTCSAHLLRLY